MELVVRPNLESALTVGQGQTGQGMRGVAAVHFFGHLLEHGGLTLPQAGPHSFVLWTRRRRCLWWLSGGGEEAVDDLLRGADPRRAGEDGSNRGHSFLIGLLAFSQACFGLCAFWFDHGDALTVDGRYQDGSGGGGYRGQAVESIKVFSRIRQDLFEAAFGDGNAGQLANRLDRFQKRILYGCLDQARRCSS